MNIRHLGFVTIPLGVLLLSGCTVPTFSPQPSSAPPTPSPSASVSPSASPSPSASATPEPAAIIPSDCRDLVDGDAYATYFGDTPLNDPAFAGGLPLGEREPTTPPADATMQEVLDSAIQLDCIWSDPQADITGLEATVATVDRGVGASRMQQLAAGDRTCYDAHQGRVCESTRTNDDYPVLEQRISFLRDDVFIEIDQANTNTVGLIDAIVATMWP